MKIYIKNLIVFICLSMTSLYANSNEVNEVLNMLGGKEKFLNDVQIHAEERKKLTPLKNKLINAIANEKDKYEIDVIKERLQNNGITLEIFKISEDEVSFKAKNKSEIEKYLEIIFYNKDPKFHVSITNATLIEEYESKKTIDIDDGTEVVLYETYDNLFHNQPYAIGYTIRFDKTNSEYYVKF